MRNIISWLLLQQAYYTYKQYDPCSTTYDEAVIEPMSRSNAPGRGTPAQFINVVCRHGRVIRYMLKISMADGSRSEMGAGWL